MNEDQYSSVVNAPTSIEGAPATDDGDLKLDEDGRPDYAAITAELETERTATSAGRELAAQEDAATAVAEQQAETERKVEKAKQNIPEQAATVVPEGLVSPQLVLIAKRERELRAAKESLESTIANRVAEEIATYKAQIKERATKTPHQFYKEDLGVESVSDYAADLWYSELGDDAPDAFKRKQQESLLQRKLAAMEAKFDDFKVEQERATVNSQKEAYVSGLGAQLESLPESMPYLKMEYQEDPKGTLDALCQAAGNLIEATGKIPTAREVTEALEEQIEKLASRYSQVANRNQQPATPAPSKQRMTTLNSNQIGGRAEPDGDAWDRDAVIAEVAAELQRANRR